MSRNPFTLQDPAVWQKAIGFIEAVLLVGDSIEGSQKHHRLMEQIDAAATSAPMNIAEKRVVMPQGVSSFFIYGPWISV
jgi:hypothetical protein